MVKYPEEVEGWVIIIVGVIVFFSLMVYGIYLISYDEGYYDAKQEDYCHQYCFDTFAMSDGIAKVDKCYNLCMEEKSYTNYWHYPKPKVEWDNDAFEINSEGDKDVN